MPRIAFIAKHVVLSLLRNTLIGEFLKEEKDLSIKYCDNFIC